LTFSSTLINWYKLNHRQLPWRETKDPYLIWLSEVILQQTRVEQGLPYFLKFAQTYPTVLSLSVADEGQVLKLWQGLGYYSRARNLLKTAKEVCEKYNGVFPADFNKLLELTGIGEYTAAAIASFAFDLPYPVVDGNVFRVLARIYGVEAPVPASRKIFYEIACELMDSKQPASFNQAIMEFGATLCLPKKPLCHICPFALSCIAYKNDRIALLPVKPAKGAKKERYFSFFYIDFDEKTMLNKRTGKDIWHNLYEFPSLEFPAQVTEGEALDAFIHKFKLLSTALVNNPVKVKHVLTHQNINAFIFHLKAKPSKLLLAEYQTVDRQSLSDFAVPKIMEHYIKNIS
jgi:A/G-specific adenine glycosylase